MMVNIFKSWPKGDCMSDLKKKSITQLYV